MSNLTPPDGPRQEITARDLIGEDQVAAGTEGTTDVARLVVPSSVVAAYLIYIFSSKPGKAKAKKKVAQEKKVIM